MNQRGQSKVSEFSRSSTYGTNLPDQTNLTHLDLVRPDSGLLRTDTFVSSLDNTGSTYGPRKFQGVRFNDNVLEHTISDADLKSKKKPKLQPIDLKGRLYQRPDNNVAIQVIRSQEALRAASNKAEEGARVSTPEISFPKVWLQSW